MRILLVGLCLASLAVSTACAPTHQVRPLARQRVEVSVQIQPDANLGLPITVQVLILRDEAVLDEVQAQSARDWFQRRQAFFRDKQPDTQECAEGGALVDEPDRCLWEWIPGQQLQGPLTLTYPRGAQWAVVLADYRTEGGHQLLVDPRQDFTLVLGAKDFTVHNSP